MNAHEKLLLIPKIENGIVIDHVPAGQGVRILRVMGRHPEMRDVVTTVGLNFPSRRMGVKDLVKLAISEPPARFLHHLSIICPGVTVKRIKNYVVEKKIVLEPPELIEDFMKCPNPACITSTEREAHTCFHLLSRDPMSFRCNYCERRFSLQELDVAIAESMR